MTKISCAKLCKRVQKNEIIHGILTETRANPKITNLQLSLKLLLHRNTISKYRKIIRETYYKSPQEIVNKIDSRLDEELEAMSHVALLTYRSQLVPKKTEIKADIKEEVKKEYTFNFNEMPEDECNLIKHAVRVYLKGRSETRPSSIR